MLVPGSQLVAEIWDYWLYSMNAPFGRTRGGEPDSPYNGFCTITHFQICRGLDQVRGLASTHNGEPRAGGRRRGRGNRRRHGTRLWRLLWRRSSMTSLTSNPVKRPHTDQAQVEVPADRDEKSPLTYQF